MTDLTEQYKKGELKAGYYYVKNEFGNIFPTDYSEEYDSINDSGVLGFWNEVSEITEVIDKVPTYKEYQALLSDQLAKNEGVEINAELKAENERLKTFLKKAINLVMESNWENHAHYKESIQLRDETNNLLNDSPSPTDLKQG